MILFLARSLGLTEKVVKLGLIAIALILAAGAFMWLQSRERADDAANRQIGATEAVVAGQTQTLEQLESANVAEQELRAGGDRSAERYRLCMQSARTPTNCLRYHPDPQPE